MEKVMVEDYAAEGKSLAKVDGKVIFIEGVVPGDVVDVQLGRNKKDWAEGRPLRFHSYSVDRVKPFCSHFGICGGCQWQMLPYEKQLLYKQKQVKDNLQRIGKVALPEMMPILGAAETRYYRNKMEYTFGTKEFLPAADFKKLREEESSTSGESALQVSPMRGDLEGAVAGFHAKGMFDKLVDIQTCYLQDEPTNAIRLAVKKFAKENSYTFYDVRNHVGFLRTMQIRLCTTGELMVNIMFGEEDKSKREALLDHVMEQFPSITTLLYTINTKWNDSLFDLEPVAYHGKGYVIEKLEDFQFKIGPKSFFQTNTKQGEQLYRVARDFAELSGDEIVYDLYCGTGSIGIFVSKKAQKIIGVEMIAAAIEDAKENAALNNLNDTAFFAGDVIEVCNDAFFAEHGRPDVIITDPPRTGMHEKLVRKILDMAAPTVVYVSCNPATQARDLNLLDEKYAVTKIQPVDMFPHTLHIENVVQLKLKNNEN
ncbi:MAG TPA: 23S rRNA (uracil(1939)-C(5))-methyltransferase RlmD [Chitinophagaceae bacterium]|nr:23S rRNA (uracil(1939)-C(5))-methyltransferase RlmD [Chitinophagaceae bacterium]